MATQLERILEILKNDEGVKTLRTLSKEEKQKLLDVEKREEKKIVYGMCMSLNKGVREALQRDFTIAIIINTSEFKYPNHPSMIITCEDQVIGEVIIEKKKVEELRKDPSNVFIWDNFVVYMKKLPRDPGERKKMRLIYVPGKPVQLVAEKCIRDSVFGTPSTEGHALLMQILSYQSMEDIIGTCLIGFNLEIKK